MRAHVLLAAAAASALAVVVAPALATDFVVYKATLKLAVEQTIIQLNQPTDLVIKRKLGNKEVINLALGRALDAKVDSKTEILAGAGTFEDPSSSPLARLIVFDPSQNGVAQVKATVAKPTVTQFNKAFLASSSTGAGTGTGLFLATSVGDSAHNGFLQTTVHGGGEASGSHDPFGRSAKIKGKGTMVGEIKFVFTQGGVTQTFDGFIVKGEGKVSGKPIGTFTE